MPSLAPRASLGLKALVARRSTRLATGLTTGLRAGLVALLCTASLSASGCKDEPEAPAVEPAAGEQPAPSPSPPPTPPSEGGRSFVEQLDLVPPNADGYLVIRDLRPLVAQAHVIEELMSGPLREAIPALAALGGGTGEARLAQLEQLRELLGLGLAALESSGIRLDGGLVVSFAGSQPTLLFAADGLEQLLTLASLADIKLDLRRSCKAVMSVPGWYACSLAGPEAAEGYAPAQQGEQLFARMRERFAGAQLDTANLALSLADGERPVDVLLHTRPELWELSVPLPRESLAELVLAGAPQKLARLLPGTSFAWAKLDAGLAAKVLGLEELGPASKFGELLSGEAWFGATDQPDAMLLRLGLADQAEAAKGVEAMAKLLPEGPLRPEGMEGLELEFDRAWLELASGPTPSIGARAMGESATRWAASLGLDARARMWAGAGSLNIGVGEVQALPQALERELERDPSTALALLPSSLAQALTAEEVGFALHLVLDHWQAPLGQAELDGLLAGVEGAAELGALESQGIAAAFHTLSPWSSLSLWLARGAGQPWILRASLVPFAGSRDADEAEAAKQVLHAILGGADPTQAYRGLLQQFSQSPRAASYRARLGEAPPHHAAVGMTQVAVFAALMVPLLESTLAEPLPSEAPAMTQSVLGAALRAREAAGSCADFTGHAGPTPPLTLSCADGEDGRCHPELAPQPVPLEDGRYPLALWTEDPLWRAIDYAPRPGTGHRAHYSLDVREAGESCRIIVEAQADPKQDGAVQIHRREATIDKRGRTTLSPLQIDTTP